MTEQDDTHPLFCFVCELAVPFSAQPVEDEFVGVCSSSIFEYLNMHTVAVRCLNLLSYLHFRVAKVIAMHETSDKTNNQCW
jgi:hypothetical protein